MSLIICMVSELKKKRDKILIKIMVYRLFCQHTLSFLCHRPQCHLGRPCMMMVMMMGYGHACCDVKQMTWQTRSHILIGFLSPKSWQNTESKAKDWKRHAVYSKTKFWGGKAHWQPSQSQTDMSFPPCGYWAPPSPLSSSPLTLYSAPHVCSWLCDGTQYAPITVRC